MTDTEQNIETVLHEFTIEEANKSSRQLIHCTNCSMRLHYFQRLNVLGVLLPVLGYDVLKMLNRKAEKLRISNYRCIVDLHMLW